ncbi:MAG: hypothetical protein HC831_31345 [Chloroflexia bacterium]|nr:hypothetical protein [Chloroflexia bacterium]
MKRNNDFKIYEETEKNMPKDSSRMLNAGANKVFYIMAKKEFTGKAMNKLLGILSSDTAIICESGGLSDYFKTGLHLHLTAVDSESVKPVRVCDALVSFNGYSFDLNIENIEFKIIHGN